MGDVLLDVSNPDITQRAMELAARKRRDLRDLAVAGALLEEYGKQKSTTSNPVFYRVKFQTVIRTGLSRQYRDNRRNLIG